MAPKSTKTKKKKKGKSKIVKKRTKEESMLSNAGSAAYWGFKAFQAMRACTGDADAIVELGSELLTEGLSCVADSPGLVVEAMNGVVGLYGGIKKFKKIGTNFAKFSERLGRQLLEKGGRQDGAAIQQGSRFYRLFTEVDSDGSNAISLEEYVAFCGKEGVSRSSAEKLFYKADVDGNGEISFEEWTKMMMGRVGRDPDSFNCAGHHGLTAFVSPVDGLLCDFCSTTIIAGSLAAGCRRCDCDSCGSCAQLLPTPVAITSGNLNCAGGHGLRVSTVPVASTCDWCHKVLAPGSVAMSCAECDCDACQDCIAASLESFNASSRTCREHHGLRLKQTTAEGYGCNFCGMGIGLGSPVFECSICVVRACVACIWTDHRRVLVTGRPFGCSANHSFKTVIVTSYAELNHRCDWCLGESSMGDRRLQCEACDVDCCSDCLAKGPESAGPRLLRPSDRPRPPLPPRLGSGAGLDREPAPIGTESVESLGEAGRRGSKRGEGKTTKKKKSKDKKRAEFAGTPFKFDCVVRVIGSEDPELDGHLMSVVGYERDCHDSGEDIVVLQRKQMVVRELAENVYLVID